MFRRSWTIVHTSAGAVTVNLDSLAIPDATNLDMDLELYAWQGPGAPATGNIYIIEADENQVQALDRASGDRPADVLMVVPGDGVGCVPWPTASKSLTVLFEAAPVNRSQAVTLVLQDRRYR